MMIYFEHRTDGVQIREFVVGIRGRRTNPASYAKRIVGGLIALGLFVVSVRMLP